MHYGGNYITLVHHFKSNLTLFHSMQKIISAYILLLPYLVKFKLIMNLKRILQNQGLHNKE